MDNDIPETPDVNSEEISIPETPEVHKDNVYWDFLDQLEGSFQAFMSEARAGDINKAAALRARKLSIALRKNLQDFRDISIAHDKTHVVRRTKKEVELSKEISDLCN